MQVAAENGHADVVRLLLKASADIDTADKGSDGMIITDRFPSPVYLAARGGHTEVVNALVSAGAAINRVRATDGATPLYIAAQEGHVGVVLALIDACADVHAPNKKTGLAPHEVAIKSAGKGGTVDTNRVVHSLMMAWAAG